MLYIHIFFYCIVLVLSQNLYLYPKIYIPEFIFISPSMWINLGTWREKYSMWRWESNVFAKEYELLKSPCAYKVFSSACPRCAHEQGLDEVGRPTLPQGDQIPSQRWLWASTCGEKPHCKNMSLFSHLSPRASWVEGREGKALVLLSLCSSQSSRWELQRQMSAWSWGVFRKMICLTDVQCKKKAGDWQLAPMERIRILS